MNIYSITVDITDSLNMVKLYIKYGFLRKDEDIVLNFNIANFPFDKNSVYIIYPIFENKNICPYEAYIDIKNGDTKIVLSQNQINLKGIVILKVDKYIL